ncbi:hypothetical protein [Streptomyces sp. NPDC052107]|uniref:hypothetical protein n=1 Tax=Streptomyces sp. NPDC052107 TaxID=3155632 RepID=UPI003421242D
MGRREKPVDPEAGVVQRFAHDLRGPREEAVTPACRAMAAPAGCSGPTQSAAAAGERLATLPVLRACVTPCGGEVAEWERRRHTAAAELAAAPVPEDDESGPYPGLARFDTGDRAHFRGRDELIAELAAHTRRHRVCALAVGFGHDGGEMRIATAHLAEGARPLDPRRTAATVCTRAHGGAGPATWPRYLLSGSYRRTCDGT